MGSFESKPQVTPQEEMKQQKRELKRAIKELDKSISGFEKQQADIAAQIREVAKKVKSKDDPILAIKIKDYVRLKGTTAKFYTLRTHLQGVEITIQTMKSTDTLGNSLKSAVKIMQQMNSKMNNPQLQRILQSFGQEMDKTNDLQDIIGEGLDDAMAQEGDEEASREILDSVMTELRLEIGSDLHAIPFNQQQVGAGNGALNTAAPRATAIPMGSSSGGGGGGGGGGNTGGAGGGGGNRPQPPPGGGAGGAGGGGGGMGVSNNNNNNTAPPPSGTNTDASADALMARLNNMRPKQ